MTDRADTLKADWGVVKLAQLADKAGIEAVIPVARWKGMGGSVNFNIGISKPSPGRPGCRLFQQEIGVFATFMSYSSPRPGCQSRHHRSYFRRTFRLEHCRRLERARDRYVWQASKTA